MLSITKFFFYTAICIPSSSFSQLLPIHVIKNTDAGIIAKKPNEKQYDTGDGRIFIYRKPKGFSFLRNLPKDAAGITATTFSRKSIKPLLWIAGSTTLLLFADQAVTDAVQQFSENLHLQGSEEYKNVLSIKMGNQDVSLLKAPKNINTALYQFGQGFPSLLIGAGLFTYGKIHKDYRAISTASQLAETFILMGVGTQVLKRITGRQSPSDATCSGGAWHFFPSFKKFQNHTPFYDAFPSGHLATLISSVTVLADNYPEKKWIKPVGYSLTGLVGYAMINNQVHWVSDYPLALALGYLCAKQVVKNNRKVVSASSTSRHKANLTYTLNYVHAKLMPEFIYKF